MGRWFQYISFKMGHHINQIIYGLYFCTDISHDFPVVAGPLGISVIQFWILTMVITYIARVYKSTAAPWSLLFIGLRKLFALLSQAVFAIEVAHFLASLQFDFDFPFLEKRINTWQVHNTEKSQEINMLSISKVVRQ